jgi:hypothetical protein
MDTEHTVVERLAEVTGQIEAMKTQIGTLTATNADLAAKVNTLVGERDAAVADAAGKVKALADMGVELDASKAQQVAVSAELTKAQAALKLAPFVDVVPGQPPAPANAEGPAGAKVDAGVKSDAAHVAAWKAIADPKEKALYYKAHAEEIDRAYMA